MLLGMGALRIGAATAKAPLRSLAQRLGRVDVFDLAEATPMDASCGLGVEGYADAIMESLRVAPRLIAQLVDPADRGFTPEPAFGCFGLALVHLLARLEHGVPALGLPPQRPVAEVDGIELDLLA